MNNQSQKGLISEIRSSSTLVVSRSKTYEMVFYSYDNTKHYIIYVFVV